MSQLYTPSTYDRPEFRDTPLDNSLFDSPDWIVELKQDGIFGIGIAVEGSMTIYSLGYGVKGTMQLDAPLTAVFVGEYMFGSNWAYRHGVVGQFVVFDILAFERYDLRGKDFWHRRALLEKIFKTYVTRDQDQFVMSQIYPAEAAGFIWSNFVEKQDYEGVVFKNIHDTYNTACWYRTKKLFSLEYICIGFQEGQGKNKGKVGSIIGGVYDDLGELKRVCLVGGGLSDEQRASWFNDDSYLGRVFTATGYKVFSSGALRHPVFKEWRDDKQPIHITWDDLCRHYPWVGIGGS